MSLKQNKKFYFLTANEMSSLGKKKNNNSLKPFELIK